MSLGKLARKDVHRHPDVVYTCSQPAVTDLVDATDSLQYNSISSTTTSDTIINEVDEQRNE